VGCEDGQEQHLLAMAEQVENRIESVKALGGQSGESKLLVLAALLMADELHDVDIDLAEARRRLQPVPRQDPALAQTLSRLADRAEEIAASLEHT
jgi:cell division protein ZapA